MSRVAKKRAYEKAIKLKAGIYHFHDPELLGLGVRLKSEGYRVVYDSHEDVPRQILVKEWIPRYVRQGVSRAFELYENWCARKYDAVIVPTPHIKERFERQNNSVWEVCNFPLVDEIAFSEDYSNRNPGCYVGDLSDTRGIRQIAEATHRIGLQLNLCGEFHTIGLQEELARKFDNVRYLGFLGRSDVSSVLRSSSMGFVTLLDTPNDSMAYPIKLFEYMAAGIPVIASDFPVYKNIVEGHNCGICVNPLDVDAIRDAIDKIVSNPTLANEMRENGRRAVTETYYWKSQAGRLMECYESLLGLV